MNKVTVAGIVGALAVGLGAFGAHGLKELVDSAQLTTYKVGVQYHLIHAIVLLGLGLYLSQMRNNRLNLAFVFILIGIFLFSGSLYLISTKELMGLTNWKWLGPITPLGGLCYIVGWLLIAFSGVGMKRPE